MASRDEPVGVGKRERQKGKLIPLLTLILVVLVTILLFLYREKVTELGSFGYLGIFLVCLFSNASVILPVPGILIVLPLATTLNPLLVGLVGATGGVIGEITGYMAGYSGRGIIQNNRAYNRIEGLMKKWGGWTIFVFAAAPYLPLDMAGMVAGALRYPLWKFLLVCWGGKSLKYIVLALSVAWGWETILRYFG